MSVSEQLTTVLFHEMMKSLFTTVFVIHVAERIWHVF